jgi:hypothetical protein
MALLQLNISLDSSWLHHLIAGTPFAFVFGFAAIYRRRIQHSEERILFGPSLHSRVTSSVNLRAIEYQGHLRE